MRHLVLSPFFGDSKLIRGEIYYLSFYGYSLLLERGKQDEYYLF